MLGPSGSGKTTCLMMLAGFETATHGEILLDGKPINNIPPHKRGIGMGMVFQQFNLFPHLTVLDNITLGPIRSKNLSREQANKLAMTYLERVKIPEQAQKYPRQLSGGQQQRVAIARSLCMEPKILLFDEPTSALDPEMISEVLDVMIGLAETGMTMICVTHEMGFARRVADKMVFMDEGKIVEMAPPSKFFDSPNTDRCKNFLKQILQH